MADIIDNWNVSIDITMYLNRKTLTLIQSWYSRLCHRHPMHDNPKITLVKITINQWCPIQYRIKYRAVSAKCKRKTIFILIFIPAKNRNQGRQDFFSNSLRRRPHFFECHIFFIISFLIRILRQVDAAAMSFISRVTRP